MRQLSAARRRVGHDNAPPPATGLAGGHSARDAPRALCCAHSAAGRRAAQADKNARAEEANLRDLRAKPVICARRNIAALAACFRLRFTDEGKCSSDEWAVVEAWYDEP